MSSLRLRLSALLVAFTFCLSVFWRSPIPSVHAAKNDFTCAYSLNATTIDGIWTSRNEWFPQGVTANLSVTSVVEFGNGTKAVFVRWILSGNVSCLESAVKVKMDGPKKVQVVWKKQFCLKVTSEFGSPKGSGWYDEGSVATFQVDETSAEILVVHVFQEWTGDLRATTPKASVVMNSPKEVRALWKTDYTRTYIILGFFSAMVAFAGVIAYRIFRTRKKRLPRRRRY